MAKKELKFKDKKFIGIYVEPDLASEGWGLRGELEKLYKKKYSLNDTNAEIYQVGVETIKKLLKEE